MHVYIRLKESRVHISVLNYRDQITGYEEFFMILQEDERLRRLFLSFKVKYE